MLTVHPPRKVPVLVALHLDVEGRFSFARLKELGMDLEALPNVWCLPNQKDICTVYRRTAALLVPSYWEEAAGRVIVEALMSGIPVLASSRGGIPGQLNGQGFLFDIPKQCLDHFGAVPADHQVQPWLDTLCRLMDDDAAYAEAVQRAKQGAEPFKPEKRKAEVLRQMEAILKGD